MRYAKTTLQLLLTLTGDRDIVSRGGLGASFCRTGWMCGMGWPAASMFHRMLAQTKHTHTHTPSVCSLPAAQPFQTTLPTPHRALLNPPAGVCVHVSAAAGSYRLCAAALPGAAGGASLPTAGRGQPKGVRVSGVIQGFRLCCETLLLLCYCPGYDAELLLGCMRLPPHCLYPLIGRCVRSCLVGRGQPKGVGCVLFWCHDVIYDCVLLLNLICAVQILSSYS